MGKNLPILSIITPTYNRAEFLPRCFASLRAQTNTDFEWIVVDDGSTDDTEAVMAEIAGSLAAFSMQYIRKENGGKHTALNAAHPLIQGKYVLILDSDDWLLTEAVEIVLTGWEPYENRPDVAMVTFLKQNSDDQICAYAKEENTPTDVLRFKRICVASGDCCEVIRAELFRKYPFPVFAGERFLAETALWYRAGLDGSCVYINKPVYVCEYLDGGLTRSGRKLRIRNPKGGMYTSYLRMNRRCRMEERLKAGLLYICYGEFAGEKVGTMIRRAKPYSFLAVLCVIPGWVVYTCWKRKYR